MSEAHALPEQPRLPSPAGPDRWLVRPAVLADAPAVLEAFRADPAMSRQGEVTDLASARRYLAHLHRPDAGHRAWVAAEGSGPARALVGISEDRSNRLGWFFYWSHHEVHGARIMKRAAAAVANDALDVDGLGLERLELGHRANNPASGGVARAAGFIQEGLERGKFLIEGARVDVLTYGRLRSDPSPVARMPLLGLRPLRVDDAGVMVSVLADPSLHRFTGGRPPTSDELSRRYARQVVGASPDGAERWVNEIVLLDGEPVGYVQATVDDKSRTAELAWVIGGPWQGRGLATQAARLLVESLAADGVSRMAAHIHPDHVASQAVARRLGLEATGDVVDGETRWEGTVSTQG